MAISIPSRLTHDAPIVDVLTGLNSGKQDNTQVVPASQYNFPGQVPGAQFPNQTLTGGVPATVTLKPVPRGINGTNTNHYLYISGGVGTAEAVLITGGTAVSGASVGTITFTPANNHSGSWTITSATLGIQEAIYAAGANGTSIEVAIPANIAGGCANLYAAVTIPNNFRVALRGAGMGHTTLCTVGTTGNWIVYNAGSFGYAELSGFTITDSTNTFHTAGAMITIHGRSFGCISDIEIENAYDGIVLDNVNAKLHIDNVHIVANNYAVHATGTQTQFSMNNSTASGGVKGVRIDNTQCVGAYISNCLIDASQPPAASASSVGISLTNGTVGTQPINEVVFTGNDIESAGTGIQGNGNGTNYQNNNLVITGGRINGAKIGIDLNSAWNATKIEGVFFSASDTAGVKLNGATNITVNNNTFNLAAATNGVVVTGSGNLNIRISNNTVGTPGYSTNPTNGINISNVDSIQVVMNTIYATNDVVVGGSVTNSTIVTETNAGLIGVGVAVPSYLLDTKPSTNVAVLKIQQNNSTSGWSFKADSSNGDLTFARADDGSHSGSLSIDQDGKLKLTNKITLYNNAALTDGQVLIGGTAAGNLTAATLTAGTAINIGNGNNSITVTNTGVTSATGTANQVTVSAATGAVTFSLPQSIATSSTPQFLRMGLGLAADATYILDIKPGTNVAGIKMEQNNSTSGWKLQADSSNGDLLIARADDGSHSGAYNFDWDGNLKLTNGFLDTRTGGSTTISTGVGSVKMSTANAATNTVWIPMKYNGTTYYVPGWTTNAP